MSKLLVISSREFIRFITRRGFVHTKGSHHVYKSGNRMVTVPERKELGKGLLSDMLSEIGISREDLIREWNS